MLEAPDFHSSPPTQSLSVFPPCEDIHPVIGDPTPNLLKERITHIHFVPSMIVFLLLAPALTESLKCWIGWQNWTEEPAVSEIACFPSHYYTDSEFHLVANYAE